MSNIQSFLKHGILFKIYITSIFVSSDTHEEYDDLSDAIVSINSQPDIDFALCLGDITGIRVNTFALKPAWHFKNFDIPHLKTDLYTGSSINYSIGRNIFGKAPNYYPLDYVYPNALALILLLA